MLALDAKATLSGQPGDLRLAKIASLREFACGDFPVGRMLLDLRDPMVAAHRATLELLPWAGFVVDPCEEMPADRFALSILGEAAVAQPGDVVEIQPERGKIATRYRRGSNGNVLFATERCNSFCLMCSQPPRPIQDDWRVAQLCELVDLIDGDEPSLAISGGEPTLLDGGLEQVIRHCAARLPRTHVHVLSNGRRFGDDFPAAPFRDCHPSLSWGIPLYGDVASLHDYVVQSRGAFAQTLRGLYALQAAGQRIELRIVLVKPVVERLPEIARFIYRNLPFVEHVALMGTEPIGFALANHDALWMDPADAAPQLESAIRMLAARGLNVSLYNLPLCLLLRPLWPFARRSISDWKQQYLDACEGCVVRQDCSGVFGWNAKGWRSRAISSIDAELSHA